MKKSLFVLLSLGLFVSCQKSIQIVITNPINDERVGEMVEVQLADILNEGERIEQFCLFNEQGEAIPYQAICYGAECPQSIVFQASVRGGMQTVYELRKGKPAQAEPRVFARFIPERKDDFAWENDRAAYRMYGPALADENPSNGVDLWLKCTDELIVDTFYINELEHGQSYHINHGKGLDCYKVGHTLGCGGIAPYVNGELLIGDHYTEYQILEQGPLRTIFRLTYPAMSFTVTVDAGAQLNKAEVNYAPIHNSQCTIHNDHSADSLGESNNYELNIMNYELKMAAGIYLHDVIDNISYSEEKGWAAYAENAVSDAGVPQGRNYAAVVMPACDNIFMQDNSLLCAAKYEQGETLTYYFGGGWSQHHYPTDENWFAATAATARCLANPLQIEVVR